MTKQKAKGTQNKGRRKKSEKGFAIVEAVAFLFVFIVLTLYIIDLFSAVHTGIVNSIAARTYLFETLQHRADLKWLRYKDVTGGLKDRNFSLEHERFHAVTDEDAIDPSDTEIRASMRKLTQVNPNDLIQKVNNTGLDSNKNLTTSIKIKTGYGICLDSQCPTEPQP